MNQFMELWTREFQNKGLPSSFRETPSNSVIWFADFLRHQALLPDKLLDLGSGLGRNAIYLAKQGFTVSCLDILPENIARIQAANKEIEARVHDIATGLPYEEGTFAYAIDVFCFSHLTEKEAIQTYLQEIKRVLKKGGIYHLSLASTEDGYYGPLLCESPRRSERIVVDPQTQISSILYQRKQVETLFTGFNLLEFYEKRNMSPMHGKLYARCILSFIFEVS